MKMSFFRILCLLCLRFFFIKECFWNFLRGSCRVNNIENILCWNALSFSSVKYFRLQLLPLFLLQSLVNWWHTLSRYSDFVWTSFGKYLSGLLVHNQGDTSGRQKNTRSVRAEVCFRQQNYFLTLCCHAWIPRWTVTIATLQYNLLMWVSHVDCCQHLSWELNAETRWPTPCHLWCLRCLRCFSSCGKWFNIFPCNF